MQAILALILHLYQFNVKTVPPRESQVLCDKDWGYVLRHEPHTLRQALTLLVVSKDQSTSAREKREKLEYLYNIGAW